MSRDADPVAPVGTGKCDGSQTCQCHSLCRYRTLAPPGYARCHDLFAGRPEFTEYRARARAFCESLRPHHDQWERDGRVPRHVFAEAAKQGLYCMNIPRDYGGAGLSDFRYNAIMNEEIYRAGVSGFLGMLGSDMVLSYFLKFASRAQNDRWLRRIAAGDAVIGVAMSEPHAGSDVAGLRTRAEWRGDKWVLNGTKSWISNGSIADVIVVVARTTPLAEARSRHAGISLLLVETSRPGFRVVSVADKLGHKARDVCELRFENVELPPDALVGREGTGFKALMANLPQERLSVACCAAACSEVALDQTGEYIRRRRVFGTRVGDMQHSAFTFARLKTTLLTQRVFIDHCIAAHSQGKLSAEMAAMAKVMATEAEKHILDACVQLHGGYGFLERSPVALGPTPIGKQWLSERIQPIYAGANEVMLDIIARASGFDWRGGAGKGAAAAGDGGPAAGAGAGSGDLGWDGKPRSRL